MIIPSDQQRHQIHELCAIFLHSNVYLFQNNYMYYILCFIYNSTLIIIHYFYAHNHIQKYIIYIQLLWCFKPF